MGSNLLAGKKILIAGVANESSIAWGIAKALRNEGAELIFSCVENNVRRLKKLLPQIDSNIIIPCNVQKDEDIKSLFEQINTLWPEGLDGFVHSIAFAKYDDLEGEFIKTTREGFMLATDVSAYSIVGMAREARPLLKKKQGSIISLTFAASERVIPNYNVMAPAKAALETSMKYLAYDLGKDGIRVNTISAGVVRTASAQAIKGINKALDYLDKNSLIGRNINQDDLGGPAVFLMSDMSKAITGTVLFVDGGASILTGMMEE